MTAIKTTLNLTTGDKLTNLGGREVDRVERNTDNLGAALIVFTNGDHFHASIVDVHHVA